MVQEHNTEMGLELNCGVISGVGGHMEYWRDGVSPELKVGDMPSEKLVKNKKSVPLQFDHVSK